MVNYPRENDIPQVCSVSMALIQRLPKEYDVIMFKKFKSTNLKKSPFNGCSGVLLTCPACLRFLNESILLLGI